jgi:hypothetical protein
LIFAVVGPFLALGAYWGRFEIANAGGAGTIALGGAAVVTVVTQKYRRGDSVARRQIRWVVIGTYVGFLPAIATTAIAVVEPRFGSLMPLAAWSLALFPAFLLVSVRRFNLFDVDRILSATASFNILAVLLGAGALIGVPRIAEGASGFFGIDPMIGQVVLSVALAAVIVPAHRQVRPQIDRVFF